MNTTTPVGKQSLRRWVLFSLFATSYTPLFVLIIFRQLSKNLPAFKCSLEGWALASEITTHFGLSALLSFIVLFGGMGMLLSLRNIRLRAEANADAIKITHATNRSGEAISYIGTYILPFIFEEYSGWYETIAILFLLVVIYRIYINSSLLLINPLLNMKYALYDVSFNLGGQAEPRSGMLITTDYQVDDGDQIRVYHLGKKLYFGVRS